MEQNTGRKPEQLQLPKKGLLNAGAKTNTEYSVEYKKLNMKSVENMHQFWSDALPPQNALGLLNESHPRVFQTITLSFFIAFKARQG